MSALSSLFATAPPDAVIEIGPPSVSVAVVAPRGREAVVQGYAIEPLPPGAVVASLTTPNIVDRKAVVGQLRAALARVNVRPRRVALLIPDLSGRVSLLKFEQIPGKQEDLEQLIRWQVKKAAPFPLEETIVTFMPAGRTPDGASEFLTLLARRDVVRGYESVCEELEMHPGLIDLASLGVVNLCLAMNDTGVKDWLLVHVRPEYTSVAIVRDGVVIFFRSLSADDAAALVDVVHQTTMYYQDRLAGAGFGRVLVVGSGRQAGAVEDIRRSLETRLGMQVHRVDASRVAQMIDRITTTPDLLAWLAPLVGTWMRMRREATGG